MAIRIQGNNPYSVFYKNFVKGNSALQNISKSEEKEDINGFSQRREEYEQRMQAQRQSVVEQSMNYAQQLSASRTKTKEASIEKKKFQYNFKKISSQIIRSKNSVSARKAVQAAKREIMRLKRLKGSGEYDDEELQLAIDHAKSMEKVAKKKVSHLEQEEMVERHGKGMGAALEEIEEKNEDSQSEEEIDEEELSEEELDVDPQFQPEYDYRYEMQMLMQEYQEEMQLSMSEYAESESDMVSEEMSDMMDEFADEIAEMMEDMELDELASSLYAPDPNMSEEDLKMLKIKHRGKELKEIAQADKEYLKGIIEHQEKSVGTVQGFAPSAGISTPMAEGSFNVSI